jgi:hypothetical protein
MLWNVVAILFALALSIWLFLILSLIKGYRYATIFTDMLPFYQPLNIFAVLLIISGSYYIEFNKIVISSGYIPVYWISPFSFTFGLVIFFTFIYFIRKWRKCYTLKIYKEFLQELQKSEYSVKLFNQYTEEMVLDEEKIHVFIRHDVDLSLNRLLKLTKLEKENGLVSTLFFRLHSKKYSFEKAIPVIEYLYSEGFEIGFHYEVLSQTKGNTEEAIDLFSKELDKLRGYVPIRVVAHHGDKYSNHKVWPLIDKEKLEIWSAYDMKRDIYITDTGGKNMFKQHGFHIFDKLKKAKPGDIVQILIHADWWY